MALGLLAFTTLLSPGCRERAPAPRDTPAALVLPARRAGEPCDDARVAALITGGEAYVGCGPLPRFAILDTLDASRSALESCVVEPSGTSRRFVLAWTVTPDGTTRDVYATAAPPGEGPRASCLEEALRSLRFPTPLGGGEAHVIMPLVFERPATTP